MITFYSNENALFPVSNIQDDRRTKVFRSTSSSVSITVDLQTAEPVDSFIIVDHPKRGFGHSTLTLEASPTPSFASPAFTTTVSVDHEFGIGIKEFTSVNFRFWRLVMTGSSFVEVSKIFLGSKVLMTDNSIDYGWTYTDNDLSNIKTNRFNQRFIDEIGSQVGISFSLKYLNKTEVDQIFGIYDFNRRSKPFFIKIGGGADPIINNENRFAGYFYMDRTPRVRNPAFALYNMSMRLVEGK